MSPDFDDGTWDFHPEKEAAFEQAYYQMDYDSLLMICTHGGTGCPGEAEMDDCQNCLKIEKHPGDTLEVFLTRCKRVN